jgi:hypothetical protein
MVSRLRKTLTVQERASAFEHTNKVAAEAAEEERRLREEKSDRLRKLRLAGAADTAR